METTPSGTGARADRNVTRASPPRARTSATVPSSITRPRASKTTREAISSASASCWVVRRTAPPSAANETMSFRRPRRALASIPAVGSSRKRVFGLPASASATASRRRCPPDRPPASRSASDPRPSLRRTSSVVAASGKWARTRSTAALTRRPEGNVTSCSTAPTSRRDAGRRGSPPSSVARPASGRRSPSMMATAVDLPAPFGPSRARISPRRSSMSTPSSATILPNVFRTACRRATGGGLRDGGNCASSSGAESLRGSRDAIDAITALLLAETDRCCSARRPAPIRTLYAACDPIAAARLPVTTYVAPKTVPVRRCAAACRPWLEA